MLDLPALLPLALPLLALPPFAWPACATALAKSPSTAHTAADPAHGNRLTPHTTRLPPPPHRRPAKPVAPRSSTAPTGPGNTWKQYGRPARVGWRWRACDRPGRCASCCPSSGACCLPDVLLKRMLASEADTLVPLLWAEVSAASRITELSRCVRVDNNGGGIMCVRVSLD